MLLKFLDIQGFKSFPDRTRVAFGGGLTAVVGPNGSGKSNISDAVRWVLGEQSTKTLRGEKMEDVIFSGTKTRKAQGFAEVTLTVDNSDRELDIDVDEIAVTRRYDRSGESEYMINHSPVRLKDVHELLMDTGLGKDGYSLIGQGKIAEIIQSKSGERREVFEEAAGISKFRYRKAESERSLTRAEENLVRLRDIMAELESRVGPLKEQAEKAKRFLELSDAKKKLEVSLWIHTIEQSNQSVREQSDRLLLSQEKHAAAEEQLRSIEEEIQNSFEQMQALLVESEALRRQKSGLEAEISNANASIAVCRNDISHHEQSIARLETELLGQAESSGTLDAEILRQGEALREQEEKREALQAEIEKKQSALAELLQQNEGLTQREKELSDEVNALVVAQSSAKMAIVSAQLNRAELESTLSDNEAMLTRRIGEQEVYEKELAEAEAFLSELSDRAEGLQNAFQGHKMKFDSRMQRLDGMKRDCEKTDLQSKEKQQKCRLLEGMEQSLEGFAASVREVLKRGKNGVLTGIYGTVSQLVTVLPEYSVAVETAIGGAMQNIIVENEASAKAAIRALKQENLGRATFLPLTSVKGSLLSEQGLEQYAGFVDLAVNLVSFDEKYRGVMNSLLGRIAVVDDIDTAVIIAQKYGYKFRLVTLDGQVVNAGGSLTGGSQNRGQGFLSRKNEIQALQTELRQLTETLARQRTAMAEMQAETARIEAEYTAVTAEITTVNEDTIRAGGEKKRLEQFAAQMREQVAAMERELVQKREKLAGLTQAEKDGAAELSSCEEKMAALGGRLAELQSSNRASADDKAARSEEINRLRLEELTLSKDGDAIRLAIASLQERQLSAGDAAKRLEEDKEALSAKIEEINRQIVNLQKEIEQKREQSGGIDEAVQARLAGRQRIEGETTALRRDVKDAQERKEKLAEEIARVQERKAQIQSEYDELIIKLWDEYELTKSEAAALAEPLENPAKAATELNTLRNRIRALGSVNVAAIEEYKEVGARYDFLSGQMRDAEHSKNELLRLIGELTRKMQDIFAENFEKINRAFQIIFVELFGGGRAELRLSDPDDLLETGIDIIVEPPGKIVKNLSLLSGGEQAFVAIAIYFAILKVHPAPFCILDEIEAALDDVNVDKYAAYLKTMCGRTQFIAITHRRGTMEAADILYGVTMQDEGVSKLLQLKVSEIEEKLKMKNM